MGVACGGADSFPLELQGCRVDVPNSCGVGERCIARGPGATEGLCQPLTPSNTCGMDAFVCGTQCCNKTTQVCNAGSCGPQTPGGCVAGQTVCGAECCEAEAVCRADKTCQTQTTSAPGPTIRGILPTEARFGEMLFIVGENFSKDLEGNTVYLGDCKVSPGNINSASEAVIGIIVPPNADCTGRVRVTTTRNGTSKTATSSDTFQYLLTATVSTFAGSTYGYSNAAGFSAQFRNPNGIAIAGGNLYVTENHRIRGVTSEGVVTTFSGSTNATTSGGYAEGTTGARFHSPEGITMDTSGNLYVADADNHRIRRVTPGGVVTTFAGTSTADFRDGPRTGTGAARFNQPRGVALDADGNLYVADTSNHRIRRVSSTGEVTTFAGNANGDYADGTGTDAQFRSPEGIATDADGNLYVADTGNHCIRKVTPESERAVSTVSTVAGLCGTPGNDTGIGTAARFSSPRGIAIDSAGTTLTLYVADTGNHRIRKITLE